MPTTTVAHTFVATRKLQKRRMLAGKNQAQFALEIGMDKGAYSRVENGWRRVTPRIAAKVAAGLGLTVDRAVAEGLFKF